MSQEILKDYQEIKAYYREMNLLEESHVLDFIKRFIELTRQNISITPYPDSKYFVEITWPSKAKGEKTPLYGKIISIFPDPEKETLVIEGALSFELKKEDWTNKKVLKKTIREVFINPGQRSNTPCPYEKPSDSPRKK